MKNCSSKIHWTIHQSSPLFDIEKLDSHAGPKRFLVTFFADGKYIIIKTQLAIRDYSE